MAKTISTLLIPVENQVRELDPKLLLACVAARRGFSSVIGSRREMELSVNSFPRSIYLSKSMTVRSLLFFQVARRLGHEIVSWDEEALVHLPPETYFSRRLHPSAIKSVSYLFAWGQDNVELWKQYPHLPPDVPIHDSGTPRGDMLRPEMRTFYHAEAEQIRNTYGDFILINTNFNHVNAFGPDMNLFKPAKVPGQPPQFGRAARGMSREYAEGLRDHKLAVFETFKTLIPQIETSFPDCQVVVRPHPTENHAVYQDIAAACQRVKVINEGNVVPWLMACNAVIHNGCTTGVEAYVMGVPAISYRAVVNEPYDYGFYRLPNLISHQCFSFDQLHDTLRKILNGELGSADGHERRALIKQYLTAQDGPLACERIVDILEEIAKGVARNDKLHWLSRLERSVILKGLGIVRRFKSRLPGSHNRPEFQRHRYPGISVEEIKHRLARLQEILSDRTPVEVIKLSDQITLIQSGNNYRPELSL
jgi:surface carbohydrate biosynthesis protein